MYFSVSGNSGICRNGGREIHLKCCRMPFPWISVGGNSGICRNGVMRVGVAGSASGGAGAGWCWVEAAGHWVGAAQCWGQLGAGDGFIRASSGAGG